MAASLTAIGDVLRYYVRQAEDRPMRSCSRRAGALRMRHISSCAVDQYGSAPVRPYATMYATKIGQKCTVYFF